LLREYADALSPIIVIAKTSTRGVTHVDVIDMSPKARVFDLAIPFNDLPQLPAA
jgi:hypothetical protein